MVLLPCYHYHTVTWTNMSARHLEIDYINFQLSISPSTFAFNIKLLTNINIKPLGYLTSSIPGNAQQVKSFPTSSIFNSSSQHMLHSLSLHVLENNFALPDFWHEDWKVSTSFFKIKVSFSQNKSLSVCDLTAIQFN